MAKENDYFAQMLLEGLGKEPALRSAFLAQDYSARVGFDFADIEIVLSKVKEEYTEMEEAFGDREGDFAHFAEELGDCLFTIVNLARWAGLDPEELLNKNVEKYLKRCLYIEDGLKDERLQWRDIAIADVYARWKSAKKAGL